MGDALNRIRKALGDSKLKIRQMEDKRSALERECEGLGESLDRERSLRFELVELHKVAENSIDDEDMILALGGIIGREEDNG